MSKQTDERRDDGGETEAIKSAKITLLDMGEEQYGDCVLCRFGEETVLIDGAHSSDDRYIMRQLKTLLGQQSAPVRVSLLIVTHPHDDHIGCLPRLVANNQLAAEWALVADPKFRWGDDGESEALFAGRDYRERALAEALLEEDRSSWGDAELARFIENVGSLANSYRTMLRQLEERGTTVVHNGSDDLAPLHERFAGIGLKVVGPSAEHLRAVYRLLHQGRHESLGFAEEAFSADETMDVVSAYRNYLGAGFEERANPNKGAINLQSIVTRFEYGGLRYLFAGDMQFSRPEVESEELVESVHRLRRLVSEVAPYAFAKLSHHASYNGFDEEVMAELGETELFGICGGHYDRTNTHPHRDVLRLLDENRERVRWVRTDHNGQVNITFGAGNPQIRLSSGDVNDATPNHETGGGHDESLSEGESISEPPAESFSPAGGEASATPARADDSTFITRVPPNTTRLSITVDFVPTQASVSAPQASARLGEESASAGEEASSASAALVSAESVSAVSAEAATRSTPSRAVLASQLKRARDKGWIPFFTEAANRFNFPVALLIAVASRETNVMNIVGDGGHGRGIMQIDDRSFPDFARSGRAMDPRQNILKGAEVLNGKRLFLSRSGVSGQLLTRASVAAYNHGEGNILRNIRNGRDVDSGTAHNDYSEDVLARAAVFTELLS
jgi:beta-lactamase superfamily II metal-dependent hydrolase/soluble lytic murein transglycosylase-like protein